MREMRAAFGATAADLVDSDDRVAVVLAEISTDYFADVSRRHPRRVVNIGIMEQAMVGVAAGFAMEGFHPIAHSLSPFMAERPYEQLKLDFGYQGLGGTFVGVGGSYDYAAEGGTHHAPADASLMLAIPGMEVLIPGHGDEVDRLLRTTYANGRPTYLRASVAANIDALDVAPGRIEVVRRGAGATLLVFGPMLDRVLAASEGLDVTVAYSTSLEPFDHVGLRSIAGGSPQRDRGGAVLPGDERAGARRDLPGGACRAGVHRRPACIHPRLRHPGRSRRRRRPRRPRAQGADLACDMSIAH